MGVAGAFLAWTNHYNGQGELFKRMAMAKAMIKSLLNVFFTRMSTVCCLRMLWRFCQSCFLLWIRTWLDERYSECQKVDKLLQCIQMPDMEVVAQKLVIASQYANDFLGACNYFLAHGGAQLENSKYMKKRNVSAMYGHGSRDGSCSGGCGRFGGSTGACFGG
jgi:hypothetical protein